LANKEAVHSLRPNLIGLITIIRQTRIKNTNF